MRTSGITFDVFERFIASPQDTSAMPSSLPTTLTLPLGLLLGLPLLEAPNDVG